MMEAEDRGASSDRPPQTWSIGIYSGPSPLQLRSASGVENPVLRGEDVTDIPASFVADPFMVRGRDGAWSMFFEVLNRETGLGEIGLATSENGLAWAYRQIVLKEPYHLSYPYVFEWDKRFYMIPETLQPNAVRLYVATGFPSRWSYVTDILTGQFADPTIFYHEARWWLFACPNPYRHDALMLFFSEALTGPWVEHPNNPIISGNRHAARPAGRVVAHDGRLLRFSQDCHPHYGTRVRAFEIDELTPANYVESEQGSSPILGPAGSGWNARRMHHVDAHLTSEGQWLACVDGSC